MNEQLTRQAQEMFSAIKDTRIPGDVQVFTEQSVIKTREVCTKMSAIAKDGAKTLEEIMLGAQSGARAIGDKVFSNTIINIENGFEAAEAMARAKTVAEAVGLQGKFMQEQLATGSEQAKELLELSTKVVRQTFDRINAAATRTFAQFKDVL